LTAAEAVEEGIRRLKAAGVDSPRLDAELLVGHVLGWGRTKLYTYPDHPLTALQADRWETLVQRRIRREPLPYLLGRWEFYGRSFRVTPAVLIPRPETELLVEGLLNRRPWPEERPPVFAEVGTGSGCIGLTLAAEAPRTIGVLTDSSAAALEVARANARDLGVAERVEFRHAAFPLGLDDFTGRLDVLVSNPPYVADKERVILPPEVAEYEPQEALFAGEDGLSLLRLLLERGRTLLRPGGWIALEFGIGQADPLTALAHRLGYEAVKVESDLSGLPRILFARLPASSS
jgi:release factor glutamine methyltransferase